VLENRAMRRTSKQPTGSRKEENARLRRDCTMKMDPKEE
jgi:hypothetical protein